MTKVFEFTKENFKKFKEKVIEKSKLGKKEFKFEGRDYNTVYAWYLVEYLETNDLLKKED